MMKNRQPSIKTKHDGIQAVKETAEKIVLANAVLRQRAANALRLKHIRDERNVKVSHSLRNQNKVEEALRWW